MRSALVPILLADPLPWAQRAEYAWDFLRDRARFGGAYRGALANTPNWTFTRASTGYAQNQAGVLIPFASGELRRTDKGVLIEEARTNRCLQSQTFDNASWNKTNATVVANAVAGPDGTTTADKLIATAALGQHRVDQTPTSSAGAQTHSVYAKAGEYSFVFVRIGLVGAWFNLSTGAVGTVQSGASATITALASGWYRCVVTVASAGANDVARINACIADNATDYTGDGTSGIYLWGAQLEAASFPSSYIPTTTASATRAADSLTVTGVTGLDYPLTLYCEFERVVDTGGSEEYLNVRQTNNNERVRTGISSADLAFVQASAGGVDQGLVSVAGAISTGVVTKVAARCAANSLIVAKSGTLSAEDTSVTVPATPNEIIFSGTANIPFGYLRRAAIYASAKTDAQLQAMTNT